MALLLPLLLLGILEVGLRLGGHGVPTGFFLEDRRGGIPVVTDNARFSRWFFPPAQAREVAPFSIPAVKPPGTYRIFVLGESAAMGDPEPAFSFARMIGVMLREKYPGAGFEVVNAGITAINSHVILPIARDCAGQDADLWLIYMGNNEVVGPFGAGTVFGAAAPPLPIIRARVAARSLRIGQAMTSVLRQLKDPGAPDAAWGGMKMFLDRQVAEGDPRMERVYSHFEDNLGAILRAGARAGVQQIVCTVGSNLRDCPPFASLHRVGLHDPSAWDSAYRSGLLAESAGHLALAVTAYAKAVRIDQEFAELHFRRGRCLLALGRHEEAHRCFERARDLDALRFRADSRINRILERQARERAGSGVHFLDAAALLAEGSPHGIPGEEMFYEHVHLTFQGNYLIARAAVERVASLLPEEIRRRESTAPWLSAAACAQRLGWNDWSERQALATVHERLREAPFVNQMGHAERMVRLERRMAALAERNDVETMQKAAEQYRRAIERQPDDAMLRYKLAALLARLRDADGARAEWEAVIRLLPHDATPYEGLGMLLYQTGRGAEAERQFAEALRIEPASTDALNGMGLALIHQGRLAEAIRCYERALSLDALHSAGLRVNLAFALERQGRIADAELRYREALRLEPQDAVAGLSLGALLLRQERLSDAVAHLQEVVRRHPQSAHAHLGLGVALAQQSHRAGAEAHLREALRLDPGNESARRHLEALAPPRRLTSWAKTNEPVGRRNDL